eukprot:15449313-Alexandrium_andersonii.AAC.1
MMLSFSTKVPVVQKSPPSCTLAMGRALQRGASRMGAAPAHFASNSWMRHRSGDSARYSNGTAELPWTACASRFRSRRPMAQQ